ncbi:MAG: hypothetical protein KGM99_04125 [Burkholderiales bacterium]|nr:hypothetical protein [Burkholderiales bacterium]
MHAADSHVLFETHRAHTTKSAIIAAKLGHLTRSARFSVRYINQARSEQQSNNDEKIPEQYWPPSKARSAEVSERT